MKWNDLLHETYGALTVNKVRTGLTMLGIVIGIGAVIGLVALGAGTQASIQNQISSIGSNMLTVRPGSGRPGEGGVRGGIGSATTLTLDDVDALRDRAQNVLAIAPEVSSRQQVTARGTNTNTSIIGTTPDYISVRSFVIEFGTFFTEQNIRSASKVAVLGPETVTALFGEDAEVPLGQKIRISGSNYTIIGVTKAKGGSGFGSSDDAIYIPITTAQRFLTGSDTVNNIYIQAETAESMTALEEDIDMIMRAQHNLDEDDVADFSIFNQADIVETASAVTSAFTMLLAAIAGISLLVGGIGIMNMMLTSVTERTREIGLRKAIGAKQADISKQFLLEAILLTLVGGALGIALGYSIAFIASAIFGIAATVTLSSVLIATGVCIVIGVVFGYYPARRASRLDPIDALRYE